MNCTDQHRYGQRAGAPLICKIFVFAEKPVNTRRAKQLSHFRATSVPLRHSHLFAGRAEFDLCY